MNLSEEEQKLVDRLKELRPDLITVPRKVSWIMALRGLQYGPVFERYTNGDPVDLVSEHIRTEEFPTVEGMMPDPQETYVHEDPREYAFIAAVWEGCIDGFEEWQDYRKSNPPESHKYADRRQERFVEFWDGEFERHYIEHELPNHLKDRGNK